MPVTLRQEDADRTPVTLSDPPPVPSAEAIPVTVRRKRYVFLCVACDLLFDSSRSHQLTCSPACRVRLHRHPELMEGLRQAVTLVGASLIDTRQAAAMMVLRPDLEAEIWDGRRTLEDVQPEIWRAYLDRVWAAARMSLEHPSAR